MEERIKKILLKIDTVKTMNAIGFLPQNVSESLLNEVATDAENWEKNSGTKFISKRRFKKLEKRLHVIIEMGLRNTYCNLFLTNIPTEASLQSSSESYETVTPEHIFDTLVYYGGNPSFLFKVGPDSYAARLPTMDEAKEMKKKLHGMFMNTNKIRLYTIETRPKVLVQKSLDMKCESKSYFMYGFVSVLILLVSFIFFINGCVDK